MIPSHRDFLKPKYPFEWLRIRETDKGSSVNYKHFYPEEAKITDYCDEFETEIENPDSMFKILKNLDFIICVVVDKKRSAWEYKETEFVLDIVKDLGNYIEIESLRNFDDVKKETLYLRKIIKETGVILGKEDYRGYPYLILNKGK